MRTIDGFRYFPELADWQDSKGKSAPRDKQADLNRKLNEAVRREQYQALVEITEMMERLPHCFRLQALAFLSQRFK